MSSGTDAGVTFSMIVKVGRSRTVVGWSVGLSLVVEELGIGMLEAEIIKRYGYAVSKCNEMGSVSWHTPFLGFTPQSLTASITLPFSSSTSLTQSDFPVATIMCVA